VRYNIGLLSFARAECLGIMTLAGTGAEADKGIDGA